MTLALSISSNYAVLQLASGVALSLRDSGPQLTLRNELSLSVLELILNKGPIGIDALIQQCVLTHQISHPTALLLVRKLIGAGALNLHVLDGLETAAIAKPISSRISVPWQWDSSDGAIDAYTSIRLHQSGCSISSPIVPWVIEIENNNLDFISVLNASERLDGMSNQLANKFNEMLVLTSFRSSGEQQKENLRPPHELDFHIVSRGRSDFRLRAGTYPLKIPEPERRYVPKRILSILPIAPARRSSDRNFFDVLTSRASSHERCANLTIDRVLQVAIDAFGVKSEHAGDLYTYRKRNFPSAGGLHELELFCIFTSPLSAEAELLYFEPVSLRFQKLGADQTDLLKLLEGARQAWGAVAAPRALFIVASRLSRIGWKYENIAYRLTLLNAGCALQTLALCTEVNGLCGCPIGSGNSELFSRIILEDEFEMTSIAEYGIP